MKNPRKIVQIVVLSILVMGSLSLSGTKKFPYQNANLPIEERVNDLLGRMTLEEKFWQMFMIPGDLRLQ